jgi:CBS domain-containing protein
MVYCAPARFVEVRTMQTLCKPFHELTAADLMTEEVIALPRHLSLSAAATLLSHAHITGAPVVDEEGACVGVISGSDFIRWARYHRHLELEHTIGADVCSDWQVVEPEEETSGEVVDRYMTRNPVMAFAATSIQELASMMLQAHIHRIIIVDADHHPIGVVSSTDVLAAVAACRPE